MNMASNVTPQITDGMTIAVIITFGCEPGDGPELEDGLGVEPYFHQYIRQFKGKG
jgi:hypothetical protein